MHYAWCLVLQFAMMELLIDHGADIDAKTRNGETVLGTNIYRHFEDRRMRPGSKMKAD